MPHSQHVSGTSATNASDSAKSTARRATGEKCNAGATNPRYTGAAARTAVPAAIHGPCAGAWIEAAVKAAAAAIPPLTTKTSDWSDRARNNSSVAVAAVSATQPTRVAPPGAATAARTAPAAADDENAPRR